MLLWVFAVLAGALAGLGPRPKGQTSLPQFRLLPAVFAAGLAGALVPMLPEVWGRYLFWAGQGAMLALLWANRNLRAVRLLAAGAALNGIAIISAGGHMPVKGSAQLLAEAGVKHGPFTGSVLNWLGDWILIPVFFKAPPNRIVASPGDLLIALAIAWLARDLVVWIRSTPTPSEKEEIA